MPKDKKKCQPRIRYLASIFFKKMKTQLKYRKTRRITHQQTKTVTNAKDSFRLKENCISGKSNSSGMNEDQKWQISVYI